MILFFPFCRHYSTFPIKFLYSLVSQNLFAFSLSIFVITWYLFAFILRFVILVLVLWRSHSRFVIHSAFLLSHVYGRICSFVIVISSHSVSQVFLRISLHAEQKKNLSAREYACFCSHKSALLQVFFHTYTLLLFHTSHTSVNGWFLKNLWLSITTLCSHMSPLCHSIWSCFFF